jgi:hypothetical protein
VRQAAHKEPRVPDTLIIALCLSIGCAVAWMLALYTARGERRLLSDMALAIVGAAACAFALSWASPTVRLVALVIAGPVCGVLAIKAGDAVRRMLQRRVDGQK